jgi:hydroxymethylpyrimidine/phosphomethylpyrimidine kinase
MRKALTIAGSDSGGGAGIQADLKSFSANGVFGMSVLTAITAQNTHGVTDVCELPLSIINSQIDAIYADMGADAVKTGMLASPDIVVTVAEAIKRHSIKRLVVDTVMIAKGGSALLKTEAVESIKKHLIPLAEVITPNMPEASVLLGYEVTEANFKKSAEDLLKLGCRSVLLKGIALAKQVMICIMMERTL